MHKMTKILLATLMLSAFSVANAEVVQVWQCNLHDGKTGADVMKASSTWLAAHKSLKGGEKLEAHHEFPLAANVGDGKFNFVMILPDTESWGVFMGGHEEGSAASETDNAWGEVASCESSTLWDSIQVE